MTAVWSLNEIQALAQKAARGAGYDWGLAEEAAQAVRWLLARNLPGADALLLACETGGRISSELCPLTAGCAWSDGLIEATDFAPRTLRSPLLLLPFLAWTAQRTQTSLCASWRGAVFVLGPDATVKMQGEMTNPKVAEVTVSTAIPEGLEDVEEGHRASVDCAIYVALSELAGRTYAPATDASRQSGAGAGLTDND